MGASTRNATAAASPPSLPPVSAAPKLVLSAPSRGASPTLVRAARRGPVAHAQCALVRDQRACGHFVADLLADSGADGGADGYASAGAAEGRRGAARPAVRHCPSACHGRGVCNLQTGRCACEAGFNGSACEGVNQRPCNGPRDGLWLASHCAGECDEATGFCWCPGKLRVRPMGESCQPRHMPLPAFAALHLGADSGQPALYFNQSVALPEAPGEAGKKERSLRGTALTALRTHFEARPAHRAAVLRDFWFGHSSEHGPEPPAPDVAIPTDGSVPHSEAAAAGARGGDGFSREGGEEAEAAAVATVVRAVGDGPIARAVAAGALFRKASARGTWPAGAVMPAASGPPRPSSADGSAKGALGGAVAWCAASQTSGRPAAECGCAHDGEHGPLCEGRHEAFCLNQCVGHGRCAPQGGHCHCDAGYFGVDCSLTVEEGATVLHKAHAAQSPSAGGGGRGGASGGSLRPRIFVYELAEHTTLVLQYRAAKSMCTPRRFTPSNETEWNGGYAYIIDVALHEALLRSPHRTASPDDADFFYIPTYLSCAILPVYDYIGPAAYMSGFPMRPVTAMRMLSDAVERVKALGPHWRRSGGRDHIVLISHDEGGCWAPAEVAERAIILTHWGRMDPEPTSSSRYGPDNWESDWKTPIRGLDGNAWSFGGGSRGMIGRHPCYDPRKDIVIPVFTVPGAIDSSPWLLPRGAKRPRRRSAMAYFSGNLARNEPKKYSRGIRHRLVSAFEGKPGWRLVGSRGGAYGRDLDTSEFCIVPPGGDGWSSRVDDAVRHGCIPVIIMDRVHMPFESVLDYSQFALRVAEADVEQLDATLRAVPTAKKEAMREAMRQVWTRFTYASALLDDGAYLPRRESDGRELPRPAEVRALRAKMPPASPDALRTILMVLHARRRGNASSLSDQS